MNTFLTGILRLIGWIPLPILAAIGDGLGWVSLWFSKKARRKIEENLAQAGIAPQADTVRRVFAESAKSGLELAVAWTRSPEHMVSLFKEIHGWEHIEAALEKRQGLLLITPHLGSYDLAGRYISERLPFPLTAMYRPPRLAWLEPIMNAGRIRGKGRTAPTNLHGVKQVLKALKNGEATILLPDQVPNDGDGVWVDFFDKPAYTMSLAARLMTSPQVTTLFFCGERLPHGRGFALHIAPLSGSLSGDKVRDTRLINRNVEAWVRRFPTQYLFSYDRYKGHPPAAQHQAVELPASRHSPTELSG